MFRTVRNKLGFKQWPPKPHSRPESEAASSTIRNLPNWEVSAMTAEVTTWPFWSPKADRNRLLQHPALEQLHACCHPPWRPHTPYLWRPWSQCLYIATTANISPGKIIPPRYLPWREQQKWNLCLPSDVQIWNTSER